LFDILLKDFGVSVWKEDGMLKKKPFYKPGNKGIYYVSGKEQDLTFTPQFDLK
jgi:hypothetical protein